MRKLRVYVDTSVFGGADDEEFAEQAGDFLSGLIAANSLCSFLR